MSVEYTKNLYKQKISFGNYVQILEDSKTKVVSLDLINTIISNITEDKDPKRTLECLQIFFNLIKKRLEWTEAFLKSEFLEIISSNKLEYDSYNLMKKILEFCKVNEFKGVFVGKRFNLCFLRMHFYNYALYKEFFEPYKFDNMVNIDNLDPIQIGIYKNILKPICLKNRGNEDLMNHLNSIDFDVNFHKAIVDKNKIIDITSIPIDHIFSLYPYQISNISNILLCKFYLCSSSLPCECCGKELLSYNYDKEVMDKIVLEETDKIKAECTNQIEFFANNKHRRFLEIKNTLSQATEDNSTINEADFLDLAYFIIHKKIDIDQGLIKTLLRAVHMINDNICLIKCFSFVNTAVVEHENIFLYYVKNLTENICTKNVFQELKMFLKIYDALKYSDKITFALFVLLFQFYKEVKNTNYQKDFLLSEVFQRKPKILKIIKWILEYYISKINDISECFGDNFIELCNFLTEDNCEKFVEQHMNYIYPIIYSKLEFINFVEDKPFNDRYFHFIVVNYILMGEISSAQEFFKDGITNSDRAIDVLICLLLEGVYDINTFNVLYEDWVSFVDKNIIKILFELRKKYFEQGEQITICIFSVLRKLLKTSKEKPDNCNRVFTFIESFISKGCKVCNDSCMEFFVRYCVSNYAGISNSNINRINIICSFENMLADVKTKGLKENMDNVLYLVSANGYLGKKISQKALVLFKSIFGNGKSQDDEVVIQNYISSFMHDIEVGRTLSKIYDKVTDKEFMKLIGYIPEKLLFKEQKRKLSSIPFLQDKLEDIAKIGIEKFAMNIEIEDQDLHCFIIQEMSKYTKDSSYLPSYLLNTKYSMNYEPINNNKEIYKKSYGYEEFLDGLFNFLLFTSKERGCDDYFNFFKYGNLLGTKFLEYSCIQLFNTVMRLEETKVARILENILRMDGVNYKVIKFLINLDVYTNNSYFSMETVLEKSLLIGEFHYCIFLIEKNIRETNDRNLYNFLQYFYYKIKDHDKTRAINTKFSRINSINLFFEFILDRNIDAARNCLSKVMEEDSAMLSYLNNILNENEEEGFIKQCGVIAHDLSEWRNIHSKNRLCLHFLKDCEMLEKSKDINKTLNIITQRRKMAGDEPTLIKCHHYLVNVIENNADGEDNEPIHNEQTLYTFGCSGIYSSLKQNETSEDSNNFEQELHYSSIRKLIEQEEYNKAIKIISSLLSKKDWGVLFEFSTLYLKQNKFNKSKECLKKVLNLFPKTSCTYKKAYVRYAELVDSKQIYEDALTDIKDSSYLYLLYAKNVEQETPIKSVEFYINSVLISDEHKFETIPKVFHILSELNEKKSIKAGVKLVSNLMEKNIGIFLPFFSQIITRLNHKNKEVADLVECLILKLMELYQHETHWKAILLMNSNDAEVKQRTKNIITGLSLDKKVFLNNVKKFSEVLSGLANCSGKEICLEKDFPEIYTLIEGGELNVPNTSIRIEGADKRVEIYSSLQAPKKVSFIGADGKIYRWLCKYRDDLRKDSRFMELNCLINSLFAKNKSSNHIRTYEVIPFSHNYGIIEYIDGLTSLKSICNELYTRENISISSVTKKYSKTKKMKAQGFKEVLPMFPPRFYRWFEENFNTPYNWYLARDNYTKTCAVMNIMGWFMGLGDRHADNILFDVNVGDTVHVDLNSIFESAKKLSIPERVPFRLTQNIIDAFGVLGLEGTYSNTMCETLDLFFKNNNLIIANLLSFVYDPLHEWRSRKEKAPKLVIDALEKKLTPTDVTSKVEHLNEEAMSSSNLCEMYIGWLPFI